MNKNKMLCLGAAMVAVLGAATLPAYANEEKATKAVPLNVVEAMPATKINSFTEIEAVEKMATYTIDELATPNDQGVMYSIEMKELTTPIDGFYTYSVKTVPATKITK